MWRMMLNCSYERTVRLHLQLVGPRNTCGALKMLNVLSVGGWDSLRNYDLAAYHQMRHSYQFEAVVMPKRVSYLALRLCLALAPLIVPRTAHHDEAFKAWTNSHSGKNYISHFEMLFKSALKLKIETTPMDEHFSFIVHSPAILQPETPSTSASRRNVSNPAWKHASLHVFQPVPASETDYVADATIQPGNFRKPTSAGYCSKPLCTPFVICSEQTEHEQLSCVPLEYNMSNFAMPQQHTPSHEIIAVSPTVSVIDLENEQETHHGDTVLSESTYTPKFGAEG
jgi:hypothetical protein